MKSTKPNKSSKLVAKAQVKMIRNKRMVVNLNDKEFQTLVQYCDDHNLLLSDFIRKVVFKEILTKQYEESPTLFD